VTVPYTRVLLATEHTEQDVGAEAVALALAGHDAVHLAAVLPVTFNAEFETLAPELAARADAQAHARLQALSAEASRAGVALEVVVRRGEDPAFEIVAEARERDAELLVTRRRGRRGLIANLLVGEMVSRVLAHAPCSVLVCPREARPWQRGVLMGIDPQAPSLALVQRAAATAAAGGLPLHVCSVAPNEAARPAAARALEGALVQARAACPQATGVVRVGRPHQELIAAATDAGADLLVIGRHGRTVLGRAWIGGSWCWASGA
jgi:nucleotide-binding universal stress UspA family protein